MRKLSLFLLIFIASTVMAAAAPKVRVSTIAPGSYIQNGFWSAAVVEGSQYATEILPPPGWSPAAKTVSKSLLTQEVATVGAAAVSRKAVASVSRLIPYVGAAMMVYMTYNDIREATSQSPSEFPELYDAAYDLSAPQVVSGLDPSIIQPGAVVEYSGSFKQIQTVQVINGNYSCGSGWVPGTESITPTSYEIITNICDGRGRTLIIGNWTNSAAPTPVAISDAALAEKLNGTNTGYDAMADPVYRAELDAMFRSGEVQPVPLADYTAIQSAASQAMDDWTNQQLADSAAARQEAVTAAQNALPQLESNYNELQQKADAWNAELAADPTNTEKKAAADAATAAAKQAYSELQKAKLEVATQASQSAQEQLYSPADFGINAYDPSIVAPEKKDIPSLLETIYNSSPLIGMTDGLGINLVNATPIFTFEFPEKLGGPKSVDFSHFENIWTLMGTVMLACTHIFAAMLVLGVAKVD